jgi:hypothetical protein
MRVELALREDTMLRVLCLSVVLLIGGIACGDDDSEAPDDCDSGATGCAGTGGSKPAGRGGDGAEMDAAVDASKPPKDPPDEFDGGDAP